MIRLRVWADQRPMGWFGHAAASYFFEYDGQWLEQPDAYVLAPQFPLGAGRFAGDLVRSFFENLLPEGTALDDVIEALALRNPSALELLGELGKELPGVLSLLPEGEQPDVQHEYRPLPRKVLSERLHQKRPLLISNEHTTMSLAGAQEKMGLRYDAKSGELSESVGTSPTTHILKPDTRQEKYRPSAINEYACMLLAKALKLPVPDVWLLRLPETAYVLKRYDRQVVAGNVVGIHQFDGCQLLGHGSGWKYQRQGGLVSIAKLVAALRGLRVGASDLIQVQHWVMINYRIGNADAHAKNLSVLVNQNGFRLAPFYDLLCVRAYGDNRLALFIGDEETFDEVQIYSWETLCNDCDFRLPQTLRAFRKLAQRLLPAWGKVHERLAKSKDTTQAERDLLTRMTEVFEHQVAPAQPA